MDSFIIKINEHRIVEIKDVDKKKKRLIKESDAKKIIY